jgi:GntR family transcriptional regulator, transcriptional repressor for pyruvate dehydrogenase complex
VTWDAPAGSHAPKTAELIADRLRRQIVRGELPEGTALPSEAELMVAFGVSRPTLREAFRVLESESLIQVRRGARGGARAQTPDVAVAARYAGLVLQCRGTTLDDVFEARIVIEPPCVGVVAGAAEPATVTALRAALAVQETAADPVRAIRAHDAFHGLLVELSGNQTVRVLTGMVEHIIDQASVAHVRAVAGSVAHRRAMRNGLAAHRRVVALIEVNDVGGAVELWRRHLVEAHDYLRRPDIRTVIDLLG